MTKEEADKFWEAIEKNPAFRSELLKAKTERERKEIIKKHKYHFTKQEYEKTFEHRYHQPMSKSELKNISAAGNAAEAIKFHGSVGILGVE